MQPPKPYARSLWTLLALAVSGPVSGQVVSWDAAAGIAPGSSDPPWTIATHALGPGAPAAQVSFSAAGLHFDTTAAEGDRATMSQSNFEDLPAPGPTLYVETDLSLFAATLGEGPLAVGLAHSAVGGRRTLEIGTSTLRLLVSHWSSTSHGFVSVATRIAPSTAVRRYRLEVDTASEFTTVYVDGQVVLTTPGVPTSQSDLGSRVSIGDVSALSSARFAVHSVTHNLGSPWMPVCPGSAGGASLWFVGSSTELAAADLRFAGYGLPPGAASVVIVSAGAAPSVLGGPLAGLCVARPWSVYLPGGQVMLANSAGNVEFSFDPSAAPGPLGTAALQPGDVRFVQLWQRSAATGGAFSRAIRVQVR